MNPPRAHAADTGDSSWDVLLATTDHRGHNGEEQRQALPLLLSTRQAADLLGMHESTLRTIVRGGRVPAKVLHSTSFGGHRRFSRVQLERWAANELERETPAS